MIYPQSKNKVFGSFLTFFWKIWRSRKRHHMSRTGEINKPFFISPIRDMWSFFRDLHIFKKKLKMEQIHYFYFNDKSFFKFLLLVPKKILSYVIKMKRFVEEIVTKQGLCSDINCHFYCWFNSYSTVCFISI
jgi:hypothetical protein